MTTNPQAAQYGQDLIAEFGKQRPDFDQIKFLIQHADLSQQNARGQTPLMLAVATGNQDVMKAMLNNGAVINQKDNRGDTAAHMVARGGNEKSMGVMLALGANFAQANEAGKTPYELSQGNFKPETAARIQERFEEQDPDFSRRRAFNAHIEKHGVRTEKPTKAPKPAVFKMKH
ncbi:MAG: ankyrin repeat domain-containing protein [bacterium]|nr:ankyrin repeat domain-containing protein [bacterium]